MPRFLFYPVFFYLRKIEFGHLSVGGAVYCSQVNDFSKKFNSTRWKHEFKQMFIKISFFKLKDSDLVFQKFIYYILISIYTLIY